MIFEWHWNRYSFQKVSSFPKFFPSKLFLLSSYYILFYCKLLIINTGLLYMTMLRTLLLQATTTVKQRTGQYLPYLIHIDWTATVTPLAHFLKASPFKGFSHTFGS